jgi:hypothetical protein
MDSEYTKIFTETNIIVRGLQNQLEEKGFHCIIKDNTESGRLAGFGVPQASVELHILNKDLDIIKPMLAAYKEKIYA